MHVRLWVWALFGVLVLSALAFDLGLLTRSGRQRHELSLRAATARSVGWTALSLLFGVGMLVMFGKPAALTFVTAYLLEQSLSIDNIFVFVLIFSELKIPPALQRSVLLWGVLGALVMRGLLIAAGLFLLNEFHWVVYPFAALIIFAAVRLLWGKKKEQNLVVAACSICNTWVARFIPITPQYHGGSFVVRQAERGNRLVATPLLVALLIVETTDIVFALDSVPAVLAVTQEPFLVYTSNVFAMLGLRSLYFVLAGVVERFRFLRVGLASILIFFGVRLLLGDVIAVPTAVSLGVIAVALTLSIAVSIKWPGASTSPASTPGFRV
ncbi:MAG TPA: TerC/Alx family metal homeostasis membrane protein [Gemmatimonadaceae bacterium]